MTQQKPSKAYLVHEIEKEVKTAGGALRILEMGCGTGSQLAMLVRSYPNVAYVGIEPSAEAAEKARRHMGARDNIKIVHGLAYETESDYKNFFDLVVSMSVLEHVKDLKTFLDLSVACARHGARIIHLYDLGHALYPSSIKERIQIALCKYPFTKRFVPERKIAQYVALKKVTDILKNAGASIDVVTYHNARNNVARIKANPSMTKEEILQVAEQEIIDASSIADPALREKAFPSICVWAHRNK